MVVVLTTEREGLSGWQKRWARPVIQERAALGRAVMVVSLGRKTNWELLAQKLGRYASRVLTGQGVTLPDCRPWKRFDTRKIREEILAHTLCAFQKKTEWAGLWDPEGRLTMAAWELAQVYPQVTVWTRRREKYSDLCRRLLEEDGACLELTADPTQLADCPVIGAMELPQELAGWNGVLLTPQKVTAQPTGGLLVHSLRVEPPEEIRAVCPADIDPMELYLALCQADHLPCQKDFVYSSGMCGQNTPTLDEIGDRISTIST